MDTQLLWIIALSISTPIAGIVGFALQLRAVKKSRLENEKLQLEIEALKAKAAEVEKRIVQATTAEVQRFSVKDSILFSRSSGRSSNEEASSTFAPDRSLKDSLIGFVFIGSVILGLILLVGYFLFDIYRLVLWLSTKY